MLISVYLFAQLHQIKYDLVIKRKGLHFKVPQVNITRFIHSTLTYFSPIVTELQIAPGKKKDILLTLSTKMIFVPQSPI